jgi:hypothetical protein
MKNLFLIKTDKPSRLFDCFEKLGIGDNTTTREGLQVTNQHIYITDDSEIKKGDWCINTGRLNETIIFPDKIIGKADYTASVLIGSDWKKIILTTDQDLIADGVQKIDDEFLEWFVKNPSCEEVKIEDYGTLYNFRYLILIPQEEPKDLAYWKENAEEDYMKVPISVLRYITELEERMYSEEEVGELVYTIIGQYANKVNIMIDGSIIDRLFEQFKKK